MACVKTAFQHSNGVPPHVEAHAVTLSSPTVCGLRLLTFSCIDPWALLHQSLGAFVQGPLTWRTKASLTSFTCFDGAHYRYPYAWCLWLAPTWTLGLMHNYPPVCIPSAPGPSISTLNQVRNCTFNKYKMSRPISAVWCLETVDFKVSEIPDSKLHSVNSLQMKVFLLTTQILSYYYYKSNPMRTQISCL
jgi:hypothetical protein